MKIEKIKLTKNQQAIYDHTFKNHRFVSESSGQDFDDCEVLFNRGIFGKSTAPNWIGDGYIYVIIKRLK